MTDEQEYDFIYITGYDDAYAYGIEYIKTEAFVDNVLIFGEYYMDGFYDGLVEAYVVDKKFKLFEMWEA